MGNLHKNTNLVMESFLSTKQKEKELALEKAQVAESSLMKLKSASASCAGNTTTCRAKSSRRRPTGATRSTRSCSDFCS